jgi:hypothetical protein
MRKILERQQVGPTMSELVVSLHEIASRLGKFRRPPRPLDPETLLSLLKSEELSAGFYYPGKVVLWIAIPSTYWHTVGGNKFRSLYYDTDNAQESGTFKVRIGQFAGEYLKALSQSKMGKDIETFKEELQKALETGPSGYEVVILEDQWANYLKRHNLEYPLPEKRSTSGRHENPSWRDVSVIVGAYLIKHMQSTNEQVKLEHAAEQIFHLAKDHNIANPPAAATIKDHLSKIFATAETISIG